MEITLNNMPFQTQGQLPKIGQTAPDFTLVQSDLTSVSLKNYLGNNIIMNIFPSLDTPVCGSTVVHFNEEAAKTPETVILCISMDLPFAQKRFCTLQKLQKVITLSAFRNRDFAEKYGIGITNGPLAGLLARTVIVIDRSGKILYTELVHEITHEPRYDAALKALSGK